jgi:hypothetical protein
MFLAGDGHKSLSGQGNQLGKIVKAESANVDGQERHVSDSANKGERPRTDTDVP